MAGLAEDAESGQKTEWKAQDCGWRSSAPGRQVTPSLEGSSCFSAKENFGFSYQTFESIIPSCNTLKNLMTYNSIQTFPSPSFTERYYEILRRYS